MVKTIKKTFLCNNFFREQIGLTSSGPVVLNRWEISWEILVKAVGNVFPSELINNWQISPKKKKINYQHIYSKTYPTCPGHENGFYQLTYRIILYKPSQVFCFFLKGVEVIIIVNVRNDDDPVSHSYQPMFENVCTNGSSSS